MKLFKKWLPQRFRKLGTYRESGNVRQVYRRRILAESLEVRCVLAAGIPLIESFEVADLTALTDWTFASTGAGTVAIDNVTAAKTGSSTLRFDVATNFVSSTSAATVQLDLTAFVGADDLTLDFWMQRLISSTSSAFFMSVDVSGNGVDWTTMSPSLQPSGNVWVNYVYDLDARLGAAGIAFDSDVYVRFKQSANLLSSEVVIDDLRVGQFSAVGPMVESVIPNSFDAPVTAIDITFSETIRRFDFDADDVVVVGPTGLAAFSRLTGVRPPTDQSQYTFQFELAQTIPGVYQVMIPISVIDSSGNRLNQDQDELNGETIDDRYVGSFVIGPQVAQAIPFLQEFEVSSLGLLPGWSFSAAGSGTIGLSNGTNKALIFSQTQSNTPSTKDADLLLDLSGQMGATDLVLDFDASRPFGTTGNQLTLSVSADGVLWHPLGSPLLPPAVAAKFVIDLDEGLAAAGITPTNSIHLRFRHETTAGNRTLNLDNVRVANRDHLGPRISSAVSMGPNTSPFESIQVTFDQVLDLSTFSLDDIHLTEPGGRTIATRSPIDLGDQKTFLISFQPQQTSGYYRLNIGPDVRDPSGNQMDQDSDLIIGEATQDQFSTGFSIGYPAAQSIPFFENFQGDSLADLAEWEFFVANTSGTIELNHESPPFPSGQRLEFKSQTSSNTRRASFELDLSGQQDATDLSLDFWGKRLFNESSSNRLTVYLVANGSIHYPLGPPIETNIGQYVNFFYDLDETLNHYSISRNQNIGIEFVHSSLYGFAIDDVRVANRDARGPRVASLTTPTSTALTELQITFSEPIDVSSLTPDAIQVSGPLGPLSIAGAPVDSGDHQTFTIGLLESQTLSGDYQVTVGLGVLDLAGNPMNQDDNSINGESSDSYLGIVSLTTPITGASLPYFQGFDDDDQLSDHWFLASENGGRIRLTEDIGRGVLQMDSQSSQSPINSAIVSLDLAGKSGVRLLFEERNEDDITSSNDSIYISDDLGVTWQYALSGASRTIDGWQQLELDLDARTAVVGMTYTDNFWIRIQQAGSASWPTQGRRYDNFIVENGIAITSSLDVAVVTEGLPNPMLTVTRDPASDLSQSMEITLSSSDTSEATVPATVTILANETSVAVPVTIIDDQDADGIQYVTLLATAPNGAPRARQLTVQDNEPSTLRISSDKSSINEADGSAAATGIVTRTNDFDAPLVISLTSNDESEIVVPVSVTIPAGAASATFAISTNNDFSIDGIQSVAMEASAVGFTSVSMIVDVLDDDTTERQTIGGVHSGLLPRGDYEVLSNLIVSEGNTLTIQPGSKFQFSPQTLLWIEGTVIAEGSIGEEIIFTSSSPTPTPGDWGGITYRAEGQPRSILSHVEVSYAVTGFQVIFATHPLLTIRHSNLHHNKSGVIVYSGQGNYDEHEDLVIEGNLIHHNLSDGISLASETSSGEDSRNDATISGNEIYNNGRRGISVHATYSPILGLLATDAIATPLITNNFVHNNATGIFVDVSDPIGSSGSAQAGGQIYNNIIASNDSAGIELRHTGEGIISATLFNNTLFDNFASGIIHDLATEQNFRIRNNLVVNSERGIVATEPFFPALTQVGYNDVYGSNLVDWNNYPTEFGVASITNLNGTPADIYFNISVDPQFIENSLFEVPLTSPINDSGTETDAPSDDYLGRSRHSPFDMGVYETSRHPMVESFVVNEGSHQRSRVDVVEVTFDQLVELDNEGGSPFGLVNTTTGLSVDVSASLSIVNGKSIARLTFVPGASVSAGGTLADGNYRLTLKSNQIRTGTMTLDGNGDGTGDDDSIFGVEPADKFFRLFGDTDGDRDVDGQDYGRFGLSFLKPTGSPGFEPSLDYDGDDDVDSQDYGRFRGNFLKRIPFASFID